MPTVREKHEEWSVKADPAKKGDRLLGYMPSNIGLVLELKESQPPEAKQLTARFVLVQAGCGNYAEALEQHVGEVLTADKLEGSVRRYYSAKNKLCFLDPNQLLRVDPSSKRNGHSPLAT
jgi:hypothetical protein